MQVQKIKTLEEEKREIHDTLTEKCKKFDLQNENMELLKKEILEKNEKLKEYEKEVKTLLLQVESKKSELDKVVSSSVKKRRTARVKRPSTSDDDIVKLIYTLLSCC